jgi:hypothetical protein
MTSKLHEDGIGAKGLSAFTFAQHTGLSHKTVLRYCKEGKIFGARKHHLTKQWWIYPPAKLLCEPRAKRGNTSTPMISISLDAKRA